MSSLADHDCLHREPAFLDDSGIFGIGSDTELPNAAMASDEVAITEIHG